MSSDIIEISEINFDSLNSSFNNSSTKKTNFGGGLELLMNDKRTEKSSNIDIEDLNNLENELNTLVEDIAPVSHTFSSSLFGGNSGPSVSFEDKPNVQFSDSPNVGNYTANNHHDTKTWDGYN